MQLLKQTEAVPIHVLTVNGVLRRSSVSSPGNKSKRKLNGLLKIRLNTAIVPMLISAFLNVMLKLLNMSLNRRKNTVIPMSSSPVMQRKAMTLFLRQVIYSIKITLTRV